MAKQKRNAVGRRKKGNLNSLFMEEGKSRSRNIREAELNVDLNLDLEDLDFLENLGDEIVETKNFKNNKEKLSKPRVTTSSSVLSFRNREEGPKKQVLYTDDLIDQAITTEKIANRSIDASKIKPGTIGSNELMDYGINNTKLGDESVTSSKIALYSNSPTISFNG